MGCGGSKSATPGNNGDDSGDKESVPPRDARHPAPPKVEVTPASEQDQNEDATSTVTAEEWSNFEIGALIRHNELRALHGVPPMKLNRDICSNSQRWADHLAHKKQFEHSKSEERMLDGKSCGENLYMFGSSENIEDLMGRAGIDATSSWYDEIKDYDWSNPDFTMETGHFTQVVWDESVEMGIAYSTYQEGGFNHVLVVGQYHPAGNMIGGFADHVKPLL